MNKRLLDRTTKKAPLFPTRDQSRVKETDREALIEENLAKVFYVARKYVNRTVEIDDLISVGNIGLIKAAYAFDPHKSIQFSTYASRCIENEILMYLRKNTGREVPFEIWKAESLLTPGEDLVWAELEGNLNRARLKEVADKLPERQKRTIYLRLGLGDEKEKTQREVAEVLGVSQSYVSKVERKFSLFLKAAMEEDIK